MIWPNKIISVFRETGLKILGRIGIYIFSFFFFSEKIFLCILKGEIPFQMIKIISFSENLKNN